MSSTGHHIHGHLRVAYTPECPADAPSRVALLARVMMVRLRILWVNLVAVAGAVVSLVPLLLRRGPMGHRTQLPRQVARIIPLPPRRRASPP